jgi:hypothetical protein
MNVAPAGMDRRPAPRLRTCDRTVKQLVLTGASPRLGQASNAQSIMSVTASKMPLRPRPVARLPLTCSGLVERAAPAMPIRVQTVREKCEPDYVRAKPLRRGAEREVKTCWRTAFRDIGPEGSAYRSFAAYCEASVHDR